MVRRSSDLYNGVVFVMRETIRAKCVVFHAIQTVHVAFALAGDAVRFAGNEVVCF